MVVHTEVADVDPNHSSFFFFYADTCIPTLLPNTVSIGVTGIVIIGTF